jgi:membrane fusion protein (multidrug efflux system)
MSEDTRLTKDGRQTNSNGSGRPRKFIASSVLIATIVVVGGALALWKDASIARAEAAASNQPEPMESVTAAIAKEREHRETTTSIGTVLALRSVTLRNELPGTVTRVSMTPGQIVDSGTVLIQLDVSVEQAELEALEAQRVLAETVLNRQARLISERATTQTAVDRARAERDVVLAQIERLEAIIERKTVRAPFRARVGLADVHPGQYLNEGTILTTLQGVDDAVHVDFDVSQQVAAELGRGDIVQVAPSSDVTPVPARIVAIDSRIDPNTRNAKVRAKLAAIEHEIAPGASVRVLVPVGAARKAVAVPVSALRKGPAGDHVFVIAPDQEGKDRVSVRPVRSGPVVGGEVLILEGLEPGERVATSGSFKLREAALVAVVEEAPSLATKSP